MLLVMLFASFDYPALSGEDDDFTTIDSGNAAFELFRNIGGPYLGTVIVWIVVVNTFFAGVTSVGITGRIKFALARDGALPCSNLIGRVHSRFWSPLNAVVFVLFVDAGLQLLPLISDEAFYNLTGISTIGFQVSYAIPILLKLLFHTHAYKDAVFIPDTPYSLGKWSRPLGILSVIWLGTTSCILFLPTRGPVTNDKMNWSVVIVGGFSLIGVFYWQMYAKYTYAGPKRVVASLLFVGLQDAEEAVHPP